MVVVFVSWKTHPRERLWSEWREKAATSPLKRAFFRADPEARGNEGDALMSSIFNI